MINLGFKKNWLTVLLPVIIAASAFYSLAVAPAMERIKTLERIIPEKQQMYEMLQRQCEKYQSMQQQVGSLKRRAADSGFEPLRFLQAAVVELRLEKNLSSLKQEILSADSDYTQVVIEVKLNSVTFKQLVDLLVRVKSSGYPMQAKNLYARINTAEPNLLDAVIQVSAIKTNTPDKS